MDARQNNLLFTDELFFAQEEPLDKHTKDGEAWKVMIVDDDEEVHKVTRLVLDKFQYLGKQLQFVSAFSAEEAKKLIRENPDTSVIFLDVVMEEEDSGLKFVDYIRNTINNNLVRIILRTGRPDKAPEKRVIVDYDINDYKEKSELTAQKLLTTMITALRAYSDITTIGSNKKGLEKIIESSTAIFGLQSMNKFASEVLNQLTSILDIGEFVGDKCSGFAIERKDSDFYIISGTGSYEAQLRKNIRMIVPLDVFQTITYAYKIKKSIFKDNYFVIYFKSEINSENLIYMENKRKLTDIDMDLLEVFSTNVSIAFDNFYLNKEVENSQKEVIFTLGEIAEARSNETGHHVKRVAEYSKLLALKFGLPSDEAETIKLASPMHDVGKLAIPDAILNKPGKLTSEEFGVMKTHSAIGFDMLKNSNKKLMKTAALIALQHHEKYNGKGYPYGLKGNDIHIYGRITAIADVFDALGSNRVYKNAWDIESILDLFKQERGQHFDPNLVDLFFENLNEILFIKNSLSDT